MPEIQARTFKGTRDFLPEDMYVRDKIIAVLKSVFIRYGFAPLETPAVEYLDILTGKYGEEADKLLYPLAYKGGKELALRYDLTVPLARVVAMNPHLIKPFKRYQIQQVWRADSPQLQRGRYREFYQCDVDTVGSSELLADAEIVALMVDVFTELAIGEAQVRFNSRKVLKGIISGIGFPTGSEQDVCRSVDKLEKEGTQTVKAELISKGYGKTLVEQFSALLMQRVFGHEGITLLRRTVQSTPALDEGLGEIETIRTILDEMDVPPESAVFDFTLARGLDYYTGPIFEADLIDKPHIGSVAGGGRYDDLVGLFLKESIPAVGVSFGLERIFSIKKSDSGAQADVNSSLDCLVSFFSIDQRADCLKIVRELRNGGVRTELYYKPDSIKKQFSYADKKRIPYVIVYGPDEQKAGVITVKNMKTGIQESVPRLQLLTLIKQLLTH